jgi:hypothetical protein
VQYRGIYPGVDLVYYGHEGELEYDFVVQPGARPSVIRLRFEGAALSLDPAGDLVGRVAGGELRMRRPFVYQELKGRRVEIAGGWRLEDSTDATFCVGEYDSSRPLVIDPVLSYSTYLGGRGGDNSVAVGVDARGYAYVTGSTSSPDYPTTADALQPTGPGGSTDAFVTKLNRTGTALVYSTYFGGTGSDAASDIAVDRDGTVYIAGATGSTDFPTTTDALLTFAGETDAFVAKLDPSGSNLVYSTLLGGSGIDTAEGLAVSPNGVVYLAGFTASTDFPTTAGAFQPTNAGGFDAFVASISRDGSTLRYSTYVGSAGGEGASDIDIDPAGHAYIVGTTRGTDFPTTPGALQPTTDGLSDQAFIATLDRSGSALRYATYFGGTGNDEGFAVAVDRRGHAHIAGATSSSDLPTTTGAFQPTPAGGDDGFALTLNRTGSAIEYLTYLGGTAQDWVADIALDAQGNMYLTGTTMSANFPVRDASQPTYGGNADAFVTALPSRGSSVAFSTYIGGTSREDGMAVAADRGGIYVTGFTASQNLPTTPGAFDRTYNGNRDSFVAKLAR